MARQQALSRDTRKAMVSQFLGFGLDAYDMAMVVVMAPILAKLFIAPGGSAAWQYVKVLLLYSITMAARPVGSAFFGQYADKIGRRWLLIFTIAGVGVMSLLAGFLPTYAQAGAWAYLIFSVLRFFLGCFFKLIRDRRASLTASSVGNTRSAIPSPSSMLLRQDAAPLLDSCSLGSRWAMFSPRWS